MTTKLLTMAQAARRLGCSPASLATRPWRTRHGIFAVRLGRSLRFDEDTIRAAIAASRKVDRKLGRASAARSRAAGAS